MLLLLLQEREAAGEAVEVELPEAVAEAVGSSAAEDEVAGLGGGDVGADFAECLCTYNI